MFTSKLVSCMNRLVTCPAQRRLVRTTQHVRLRCLTNVALYLHLPSLSLRTPSILFCFSLKSSVSLSPHKKKTQQFLLFYNLKLLSLFFLFFSFHSLNLAFSSLVTKTQFVFPNHSSYKDKKNPKEEGRIVSQCREREQ